MTQKYKDGKAVIAPGTVIITSAAEVSDVKQCVRAALKHAPSNLVYVDMSRSEFELGGSAFAQTVGKVGDKAPDIVSATYFANAFEGVQKLVREGKVMAGHDVSGGGLITALLEMTFADNSTGAEVNLDVLGENDLIRVLFSEKPAMVLQVADAKAVVDELSAMGVDAYDLGTVNTNRQFVVKACGVEFELLQNHLRDLWYKTSYLLDCRQSGEKKATERYANYAQQPLQFRFPEGFEGSYSSLGIDPKRRERTGVKAAIIREKGTNGEREMAYSLFLAGFDVKDVTMTDLVSGRETLEDVNMIVFCGGFSNSDVLGSAKGWAGAFLYNEAAKRALDNFYAREDTLSLGVCNGCQLMIELGLITPEDAVKPRMLHNDSHKFESSFVGLDVEQSNAVMFSSLVGSKLGIWVAHGEGKFSLPMEEKHYNIALKYSYADYPANPNGSDYAVAGVASADGRHVAMMPHLERAIKPWNWAYYPEQREDEVTPWIEAFVNARKWIEEKLK
jgi:phosphoribosylformylglycinamidine synthase